MIVSPGFNPRGFNHSFCFTSWAARGASALSESRPIVKNRSKGLMSNIIRPPFADEKLSEVAACAACESPAWQHEEYEQRNLKRNPSSNSSEYSSLNGRMRKPFDKRSE